MAGIVVERKASMNSQHTDFVPKVKLDGATILLNGPENLKVVKQKIAEFRAASHAAEDEGDLDKADALLGEARRIEHQIQDQERLAALSVEDRASELAWRELRAARAEACRQQGKQWYFDGPNMIVVVPPEELDLEACQAAELAHRARPGPNIPDHQLIAAARVFTYRFAKADRRCRTRSEILWDAMYEIQHLTYPLMLPSEFD